jgi:hypothetical protein
MLKMTTIHDESFFCIMETPEGIDPLLNKFNDNSCSNEMHKRKKSHTVRVIISLSNFV